MDFHNGSIDQGIETTKEDLEVKKSTPSSDIDETEEDGRPTWGNSLEFLMSCIATSVGLGNIWRFPFTAYQNGGGAFLIPYVIVLFLDFHNGSIDQGIETTKEDLEVKKSTPSSDIDETEEDGRPTWGNSLEFLMSCIATSVGLGNIWRFPFTAYQNGGGAFLIPYVIVLFLVGKPMYYMETVLGQFSSRNSVRVWALAPFVKGIGWASAIATGSILSYYVAILALTLYYFAMSFQAELPWSVCQEEWGDICSPSGISSANASDLQSRISSSQLYFQRVVLRQSDGIDNGIGTPLWDLTLCLLASWATVFVVISRGVKSLGKASYFLALFPYVIMIVLFVRAVTLPGAADGLLFFITPQWNKLYDFSVWYAAVTQVFFSLAVSMGSLICYASYNSFDQKVYRDSMIVTTLDTFTSLLAGLTIFGILGNLAHELGHDDVANVVGSGGTGLAFISYPDAIAKFTIVPNLFAVLFFLMLYVLGVGTAVALLTAINTALLDHFPRVGVTVMAAITCSAGFLIGLVYVTPGGQYILELVDYYGGTFLLLFVGIGEVISVAWIYGVERLCVDIEFMLGMRTSMYWRWCWGVVTPAITILVFLYALFNFQALKFGGTYVYPTPVYISGYLLLVVGMLQVPIWALISIFKIKGFSFWEATKLSFRPKEAWGPRHVGVRRAWREYAETAARERAQLGHSRPTRMWWALLGKYKNV